MLLFKLKYYSFTNLTSNVTDKKYSYVRVSSKNQKSVYDNYEVKIMEDSNK